MAETTYLDDGGVSVTNKRAIIGSQTYAMRNVGSVSIQVVKPGCFAWGALLLGCMFLVSGVVGAGEQGAGFFFSSLLLGIVPISIALYFIVKPKVAVVLQTNSGSVKALLTRDKVLAGSIIEALNTAIVAGPGD